MLIVLKKITKYKKVILKKQQRFKSERHNVFTEEINKIALCSNDRKGMRSIDLIERYACGTSKDLICRKEKIQHNNIMKQLKNV